MPSAYRGVIGARFGCLQMGMGEFRVRDPRERAGGGPARGCGPPATGWSDPVKSVINRLWTTLVDKWSPSVRQVRRDGRQLNIGPTASTFRRPHRNRPYVRIVVGRIVRTVASVDIWPLWRPVLRPARMFGKAPRQASWRRNDLRTRRIGPRGRERRRGWHDRWGMGAHSQRNGMVSATAATGRPGGRTTFSAAPSNRVVSVRISGGVARGSSGTRR